MNFPAVLRKETLEQWRTYRFLIVAVVLTMFGLLSPVVAKLMPEIFKTFPGAEPFVAMMPQPTVKDAVAQYVKNISQFALIIGILITMGSVAQEKDKGTASLMLVKPLSRWTFLLAKLMALLVVFGASIFLAGLGAYGYTLFLFGSMPLLSWLMLNGLLLVYTLVYVALTLFFSTLCRSQALAGGLSLAALAILGILGSIPGVGELTPGQMVNWGAAQMDQTSQSAWPALWISIGLILASLTSAWLVLRRQEI
jgi:ABC-2 type transport system permease protein